MFTWLGLSNRLNIIVISINILILIVVAFLANAISTTALRTQSIERFDTKVESAFTSVDTRLVAFESFATEVSEWVADFSSLSVATSVQTEVTAFLDNDNAQDVYSISILRPEDTVIWLSPIGENIGDMPQTRLRILAAVEALENTAIQTALESDEPTWFLQETALFDGAEQATITLAIPYNYADGLGLVWVDMLQSTFTDMVTTALNEEGITIDTLAGYTAVANNTGTVIEAENLPTDALDSSVGMGVLLDRAQNAPEVGDGLVQFEDPFTQQEGLFSINSFNTSNNWLFISVLPESEIPVLPNNVYLPIFLVGVGGILILLLVLRRFLSDAVVTPLIDLGKSATEIGEGNMRFIVFHQDKRDEIGMLANAMESMRERLRESYDELENWSINLEDRVERRTVQLAAARQEAEKTAQQLQVVYDESLSVVNETQLQPVLNAFIDRITMLLESHYCAVWLLNDERTLLRLVATNDERHSLLPRGVVTIDIAQGIVGQTIRFDQPVMVNDYPNYEHRVNLADYFDDSEAPFTRGLCAPLKFDGQVIGAVVVGRHADRPIYDAEAQRQLTLFVNMVAPSVRNAQLMVKLREAVREAERANDVKTRFLASVTHELRTPLNLIINNMDFMRVGAFGDVNDEQIRRLNQTVRSAEHLLYLINDLLDVSKIEAGEMQMFMQKNDVYTLLEDAVDNAYALLESYDEKEGVELIIDIEEEMPEVTMDARRIRQVLNNLLSNAIKFTEKGAVTLKVFSDVTGIHFSVHDTGMGIPADEMDKLFAAFVRTDAAEQQAIEGTGLGLPISRYLVQQHSSDLMVISEVGAGSTFTFSLPFVKVDDPIERKMTDTQQINAILSSRTE